MLPLSVSSRANTHITMGIREISRRRMLSVNKDAESGPCPRERRQQHGGVHIFPPTSIHTTAGVKRVFRTYGAGWWRRMYSAAARAGIRIRETVIGRRGCRHRMSPQQQQQQQRRGRAKPTYHVWGMPLLLLFVNWWSWFGSMNGTRPVVLVLGESVSVGFGGGCPNACSGHGYCTESSTETCTCHQGWAGGDCSIRESVNIFLSLRPSVGPYHRCCFGPYAFSFALFVGHVYGVSRCPLGI